MTKASLATRLKSARESAGLSTRDLGRRARVSQETVRRIEAGLQPNPTLMTLRALAKALGLLLSEFVED